jgi:hypothetical protein
MKKKELKCKIGHQHEPKKPPAKDPLVMSTLYFTRCTYGENDGQYTGTISFANKKGEIKVNLDPKLSNTLLAACKDNIEVLAAEATAMFVGVIEEALKETP